LYDGNETININNNLVSGVPTLPTTTKHIFNTPGQFFFTVPTNPFNPAQGTLSYQAKVWAAAGAGSEQGSSSGGGGAFADTVITVSAPGTLSISVGSGGQPASGTNNTSSGGSSAGTNNGAGGSVTGTPALGGGGGQYSAIHQFDGTNFHLLVGAGGGAGGAGNGTAGQGGLTTTGTFSTYNVNFGSEPLAPGGDGQNSTSTAGGGGGGIGGGIIGGGGGSLLLNNGASASTTGTLTAGTNGGGVAAGSNDSQYPGGNVAQGSNFTESGGNGYVVLIELGPGGLAFNQGATGFSVRTQNNILDDGSGNANLSGSLTTNSATVIGSFVADSTASIGTLSTAYLSSTTGSFTNLTAQSGVITGLLSAQNGLNVLNGSHMGGGLTVDNVAVGTGTFISLTSTTSSTTNGQISSLTAGTGSFTTINVQSNSTFSNLVAGSGSFQNLFMSGSFTGGSVFGTAGTFNTINVLNSLTGGSVSTNSGTFFNLSSASGTFTNISSVSGTFTNLSSTSGTFTSLFSTSGQVGTLSVSNLTGTSVFATSGTFTNISVLNTLTYANGGVVSFNAGTGTFGTVIASTGAFNSLTGALISGTTGVFHTLSSTTSTGTSTFLSSSMVSSTAYITGNVQNLPTNTSGLLLSNDNTTGAVLRAINSSGATAPLTFSNTGNTVSTSSNLLDDGFGNQLISGACTGGLFSAVTGTFTNVHCTNLTVTGTLTAPSPPVVTPVSFYGTFTTSPTTLTTVLANQFTQSGLTWFTATSPTITTVYLVQASAYGSIQPASAGSIIITLTTGGTVLGGSATGTVANSSGSAQSLSVGTTFIVQSPTTTSQLTLQLQTSGINPISTGVVSTVRII
jgi:hypothetical protein